MNMQTFFLVAIDNTRYEFYYTIEKRGINNFLATMTSSSDLKKLDCTITTAWATGQNEKQAWRRLQTYISEALTKQCDYSPATKTGKVILQVKK